MSQNSIASDAVNPGFASVSGWKCHSQMFIVRSGPIGQSVCTSM